MSFPWAGFSTFVFESSEQPLHGTDSGWNRESTSVEVRTVNLGINAPSYINPLERGGAVRSWECYMTYERLAAFQAYQNYVFTLVDWDRPVPNQTRAYLRSVAQQEREVSLQRIPNCLPGENRHFARVKVEFVESS